MVADHPIINAADYLEVLDTEAPVGSPAQRTLLVRCFKRVLALGSHNVQIESGPHSPPVKVVWAMAATAATTVAVVAVEPITAAEEAYFQSLTAAENVLVVRTDSSGDFSNYNLRVVSSSTDLSPPADFDLQLSEVVFSFKVECPSDFDCEQVTECPTEPLTEPQIDYLSKDYASFRQLMLDRLSVTAPNWQERNPADLGIALVELLAYAGDQLSYYQDAVATEAYLGTARKRVSIRRHARLLDYYMHDGCNSRVWVAVEVDASIDPTINGKTLPGPSTVAGAERPGTLLLTRTDSEKALLDEQEVNKALMGGAQSFESLTDVVLREAHNEITFYTWGDDRCCLPRGATHATLNDQNGLLNLRVGDVLIFEEVRGASSGLEPDADPAHRHAVRLTRIEKLVDPLPTPAQAVANITWDPGDALPFPLCLWQVGQQPVSVVRGNVLLADYGRTIAEVLEEVPAGHPYRPQLSGGPLTHRGRVRRSKGGRSELVWVDREAPASHALSWNKRDTQPAIELSELGNPEAKWIPQRDLLSTDRFSREFVVEVEDDERAYLRFGGDGKPGRRPGSGVALQAIYRVGNGTPGNVGAEAIAHLAIEPGVDLTGVVGVRNPLPALAGAAPEPIEQVRLYAPQAFRTQERAVTADDYAAVAERHSEVQKAAATLRWTGSWHTMFVTVDRRGGQPVDTNFETEMRAHLARFRMAGHDLEVDGPRFVPLEISLVVCVEARYFRRDVQEALLETFSNADLPDGRRAIFHPDHFTFGQPVYLSGLLASAMDVPGVSWINLDDRRTRFGRRGQTSRGALDEGLIAIERLEIARLDNDVNAPEKGKIEFYMLGGL